MSTLLIRRVQRSCRTLYISIPKRLAEKYNIKAGDYMAIVEEDGVLKILPLDVGR